MSRYDIRVGKFPRAKLDRLYYVVKPKVKPKVRPAHNRKVKHLYARHPLQKPKPQSAPKPMAIDRVVMPGMLECYKCKLLCSNKDDLYTHKCLGKRVVKLKPVAKAPPLELEEDWGIRGKSKKLVKKDNAGWADLGARLDRMLAGSPTHTERKRRARPAPGVQS